MLFLNITLQEKFASPEPLVKPGWWEMAQPLIMEFIFWVFPFSVIKYE
jgi:hypothetical protein